MILTNGSGVFSHSLAEFALAAILYFAKGLRRMIHNQAEGIWEPFEVSPVSGHVLGIIGYGDIGRAIASKVRHLGIRVLAVKRHALPSDKADAFVERIYGPDRRIEMISRCDYIAVTAPLTQETRGNDCGTRVFSHET